MQSEPSGEIAELLNRLATLERVVSQLDVELRTRRVVVVDEAERERVVIETADDVSEIRVLVPGTERGKSCIASLFAAAPTADGGPGVGLQATADGDSLIELAAWRTGPRQWDANLHID